MKDYLRRPAEAAPARADHLYPARRAAGARRVVRLRRSLDRRRPATAPARPRTLRRPDRARSADGRRPGRAPALSRVHARQARPLLCQVRPAALQRRVRAGRRGLGLAVVAHRRRSLRRQPRHAAGRGLLGTRGSVGRLGRASRPRSQGRSTSPATAAVVLRLRRPGGGAGRARGDRPPRRRRRASCAGSRATASAGTRTSKPAGTVYEVDVRREEGDPTHLTCSTSRLRRPSRYVAESPRARAA